MNCNVNNFYGQFGLIADENVGSCKPCLIQLARKIAHCIIPCKIAVRGDKHHHSGEGFQRS